MSFDRTSSTQSSSRGYGAVGRSTSSTFDERVRATGLLVGISDRQCPLVFHEIYDVKMFGIEKCHPFDAGKWGRVYAKLKEWELVSDNSIVRPVEATRNDLLIAHTKLYLASLYSPCVLAKVVEVPIACFIPTCITDKYFLRRMRYQCGGTVAACQIALERGWSVHLGGGFHHAHRTFGGGFCVYADISLALKILFTMKLIEKALIVDVDAHQAGISTIALWGCIIHEKGNGHERDFGDDPRVFILDMYNPRIYPWDHKASEGISRSVHVGSMTSDAEYLRLLKSNLSSALTEFSADLVILNAGTDSLENDPLGCLNLSPKCIVHRDEAVFQLCREKSIPIVMLTSGGYLMKSAEVIANSIKNLHEKGLIELKT